MKNKKLVLNCKNVCDLLLHRDKLLNSTPNSVASTAAMVKIEWTLPRLTR